MEKSITEAECNALESTFHQIITNMKVSFPALEDLTGKALKLNAVLRTTISATSTFLEAFQKVANLALGSKGSTKELGSLLIRLCLRQRAIEEKLKHLAGSITEGLVAPLQEKLEEWKKAVIILDKDHAKESKKAHQDIKKCLTETVRLKKKSKKPKPETAKQLELALNEYNEKYETLETIEKNAVRSALKEEYNCFCYFIQCLKPVMECEVSMMAEMTQVEQLMSGLQTQSLTPFSCSDKNSDLMQDVKAETLDAFSKVEGESPNESQGSRKSSVSSGSSGCVPSPLHVSFQESAPLSEDRIPENEDSCDTITKSSSSSHQVLFAQSLTYCPPPQDQTRTIPRMPTSNEAPATPLPSQEALKTKDQSVHDLPFGREVVGQVVHQYAVPCAVGFESAGAETCLVSGDAYAKPNVVSEQQVSSQRKSVDVTDDGKRVPVVPLEGYVNMNQLACLAVQQHEMNLKKDLMICKDKDDCFDLPPPPPESLIDAAVSSDPFDIPPGTSSASRGKCNLTSRTAEDILLTGEFEVFADSVLESTYSCSSSPPGNNFNSLPRNLNGEISSSVHKPFRYTAAQRSVFGAATIRRAPARDRSLPPISRKSSKTVLLPLQDDTGQALRSNASNVFSPLRAKEYNRQMEKIYELRMESMPLPPPPVEVHRPVSANDSAVDDLPLPPPPEELRDVAVYPQLIRKSGSSEILSGKRYGSVVSSHASFIESLNVKFSERQTLPREAAAAYFARGRRASDAMCIEDVKPRNESVSPESLSAGIQRGIQLRRAVTNDRSAPRLPANRS